MTEKAQKLIEGKKMMISGGTGSFGNAAVAALLKSKPEKVIIFSRDEKKQFEMGNKYNDDRLKFIIGDIREKDSVERAAYGVDFIFHAAALKKVPNCEFFPKGEKKTNVLGTHNVIEAAVKNQVERVVVLSTDKAVYPINVMGMTKALMEKIMIAVSREKRGKTVFCGTRYGNVMFTRGSVIPYFIELMEQGKSLKITNKNMTRFMMSLPESMDLVLYALAHGGNGDIYVKKAPAATIENLAQAMIEIFNFKVGFEEIGVRPGEKMHESLISIEESYRTEDCGYYYKISPEVPEMDYKFYYFKGSEKRIFPNGYTSANTNILSKEEVKRLLLSMGEIQNELKKLKIKTNFNNEK